MCKCWWILMLLAGVSANAASFDCAKATTPQEKAICASPELSKADEQMAAAYKAVLAKVQGDVAAEIRQAQRFWIEEMALKCPFRQAASPRAQEHFDTQITQCLLYYEQGRTEQLEQMVRPIHGVTFVWRSVLFTAPDDADVAAQMGSNDHGTLQASWPQVESNAPEWRVWNEAIASAAYEIASANSGSDSGHWDKQMAVDMDTDVSVSLNWVGNDLISARVSNVWYGHGAAHPNLDFIQLNWLLKERRELKQDDIFIHSSGWEKKLASTCDEAARAQLGEMYADNPPPGIIPDAMKTVVENPESWELDADGLTIAFVPYAVGCHACTPSPVTIPWADLKPYLNPSFEIPH